MAIAYLTNDYVWAAALACLSLYAAASYLNSATKLSQIIDKRSPELRQVVTDDMGGRARRILSLLFFIRSSRDYQDDPGFNRLLRRARWSAAISLFSFLCALILLGRADISINT